MAASFSLRAYKVLPIYNAWVSLKIFLKTEGLVT